MVSTSTLRELERLLAHHDRIIQSLRTLLALLRTEPHRRGRPPRHADVLTQALALDAQRTATTNGRAPTTTPKPTAKRRRAAATLAKFDTTVPRASKGLGRGIGNLVRYGFLKKKGIGYVRTDKPHAG